MNNNQNMRVPEITSVGKIFGRNAIILESVEHTVAPSLLTLKGRLNPSLCSNINDHNQRLSFELRFLTVIEYKCWELEIYPRELSIVSSFDKLNKVRKIEKILSSEVFNHYVLSTYDYIFEIVCSNYDFKILKEE